MTANLDCYCDRSLGSHWVSRSLLWLWLRTQILTTVTGIKCHLHNICRAQTTRTFEIRVCGSKSYQKCSLACRERISNIKLSRIDQSISSWSNLFSPEIITSHKWRLSQVILWLISIDRSLLDLQPITLLHETIASFDVRMSLNPSWYSFFSRPLSY